MVAGKLALVGVLAILAAGGAVVAWGPLDAAACVGFSGFEISAFGQTATILSGGTCPV